MSTRLRASGTALAAAALALTVSACGGATVEGEAPELSPEGASPTSASTSAFAEERPEKPTSPVTPPPPPPEEPLPGEVRPEPEEGLPPAEPEPAPGDPAPPPPPGSGDFTGVLDQGGVAMPEGIDPTATATEACRRFDDGQQMVDVSGWLGGHAQLNPEQQGFFLGAAVGTFCPHNFPKLG